MNAKKLLKNLIHKNIRFAGYFDDRTKKFIYCTTTMPHLPAAAYLLDYLKANDKNEREFTIYSNILNDHWIRTYFNNIKAIPNNNAVDSTWTPRGEDWEKSTNPLPRLDLGLPTNTFNLAPPLLGGNDGLYVAAKHTKQENNYVGKKKGLIRVLRYYMLACYSLLALKKNYDGGNYVASMLVSDKGQILSYGINTGNSRSSYHHAEVNMLLSYFDKNRHLTNFPEKSVIFSTLTPCAQCTKFLTDTKPTNSYIFFGQFDEGSSGSQGTSISRGLSNVNKPLHGSLVTTSGIAKVEIDNSLNDCHSGQDYIATRIGKSHNSWELLESSITALEHKFSKSREGKEDDTTNEIAENEIKAKVLTYLQAWLDTVRT